MFYLQGIFLFLFRTLQDIPVIIILPFTNYYEENLTTPFFKNTEKQPVIYKRNTIQRLSALDYLTQPLFGVIRYKKRRIV